jgi:hypothetical protein
MSPDPTAVEVDANVAQELKNTLKTVVHTEFLTEI